MGRRSGRPGFRGRGPELELNYYPDGSAYATEYNAGEGLDHLAFKVDDLDKTLAEFEKAGYPTVLELASGSSRWAFVRDPNGISIELFTQQAAPSSHDASRSWGMQPSSKDYSQARCNEPAEGHEELRVVRRRRVEASAHLADGREEGSCSEKAEISSVWRTGG